jgi:hypothetical protein
MTLSLGTLSIMTISITLINNETFSILLLLSVVRVSAIMSNVAAPLILFHLIVGRLRSDNLTLSVVSKGEVQSTKITQSGNGRSL